MANVSQPLLDYFQDHPDKNVTLDELTRQLKQLTRQQVSGGVQAIKKVYPELISPSRGVYRWCSDGAPAAEPAETELTITILNTAGDGKMLVQDVNTRELYVLEHYKFG